MKKILLALGFVCINLVSVAHANDDFQARMVQIKIYKGDNGKTNSCRNGFILMQEIYEILNTELKNIEIVRSSNGNIEIYQILSKIKGSNYVDQPLCVPKGYKSDIQVRFRNASGKQSNMINFSIDTNTLELLEATEYPHHIVL